MLRFDTLTPVAWLLNQRCWHWSSDAAINVDASASKWSAMALGLNIRQPPAGFSPIPTYHAFHNFDHENFFSFFVDTCSILALAFWFLLSWEKCWKIFKRAGSRWSCQKVWCECNDVSRGSPVVSMIVTPSLLTPASPCPPADHPGRGSFLSSQEAGWGWGGRQFSWAGERELGSRSKSTHVDIFQDVRAGCHNWWRTGEWTYLIQKQ